MEVVIKEAAQDDSLEAKESLIKFEEAFSTFYRMHVNRLKAGPSFYDENLKLMDELTSFVEQIDSYRVLDEFLKHMFKPHKTKSDEFETKRKQAIECSRTVEDERVEVRVIKSMLFRVIRVVTVNVFELKDKLTRMFENFEKTLHEFLLHSIVDNKSVVTIVNYYQTNYSHKIKSYLDDSNTQDLFEKCREFFLKLSNYASLVDSIKCKSLF